MTRVGFALGYGKFSNVRETAKLMREAEEHGFEMSFFSETIEIMRDSVSALTAIGLAAPKRLIEVFQALFGQFRSGAVFVTVMVCVFFTCFTGASGVTILALGGLLMPLLLSARCSDATALGLVTGRWSSRGAPRAQSASDSVCNRRPGSARTDVSRWHPARDADDRIDPVVGFSSLRRAAGGGSQARLAPHIPSKRLPATKSRDPVLLPALYGWFTKPSSA